VSSVKSQRNHGVSNTFPKRPLACKAQLGYVRNTPLFLTGPESMALGPRRCRWMLESEIKFSLAGPAAVCRLQSAESNTLAHTAHNSRGSHLLQAPGVRGFNVHPSVSASLVHRPKCPAKQWHIPLVWLACAAGGTARASWGCPCTTVEDHRSRPVVHSGWHVILFEWAVRVPCPIIGRRKARQGQAG
jgi:hypothetical protein